MVDTAAEYFLYFSNIPLIGGIFLLGYLTPQRKIFVWALSLLLFTMVYNLSLKYTWQIPLPPSLDKQGYAFPSGHMHTAVTFYGTLAYGLRRYFRWLPYIAAIIFAGIGWALVFRGYHYPSDIWGSLAFGCLSLIVFFELAAFSLFSKRMWVLPFMLSLAALTIYLCFLWQALEQVNILLPALAGLFIVTLVSFLHERRSRVSVTPALQEESCSPS